jgi:hypothetical protein
MNDNELLAWMERIETLLKALLERQTIKEYYSTQEFAQLVGKAEFTIREHCGRGAHPAWAIPHSELLRFQKEGLIPFSRKLN